MVGIIIMGASDRLSGGYGSYKFQTGKEVTTKSENDLIEKRIQLNRLLTFNTEGGGHKILKHFVPQKHPGERHNLL
jgi:hypothetical protein